MLYSSTITCNCGECAPSPDLADTDTYYTYFHALAVILDKIVWYDGTQFSIDPFWQQLMKIVPYFTLTQVLATAA